MTFEIMKQTIISRNRYDYPSTGIMLHHKNRADVFLTRNVNGCGKELGQKTKHYIFPAKKKIDGIDNNLDVIAWVAVDKWIESD